MKKILFLLLLFPVMMSCEKFLDVHPAGKLIPADGDVASYDRLLNNAYTYDVVYRNNNGRSMLMFLGDDVEISDNYAKYGYDDGYANVENYYAQRCQLPYNNPLVPDFYWENGLYKAAEYFNVCIDGVNSVRTPAVDKEANVVVAQATVARAWGYFYAALGYGPVYKPNGDNAAKTIPYRVASSLGAPMEDLSTLQEVFDRVLAEVHTHLPNIPENVQRNVRFGKVQTYAFLAHYHLFTQKYDSVAYYADKALTLAAQQNGGMENLFYDMNAFSWANVTDPDDRYASLVNTSQSPAIPLSATYNREICFYRGAASAMMSYPSAEFLALFDANTDLRREYFFFEHDGYKGTEDGVTFDDGRRIINYQNKIARTSGYTYPEILLMRAEGLARTGNTGGALADLEYLFKFRHKTGTPFPALSGQDNIIQEIINERRRELPVASPKRFFDLKRLSLDTGKPWCKTSITHTLLGQTYTANVDSEYFVLPIRNTVLTWNPQWGIPLESRPWSGNPH